MQIEVSYKYSHLDKEHQFGLTFIDGENWKDYINWIWYHLGAAFGESKKFTLYPFSIWDGKKYKSYKNCNDATRQAKFIINAINKKLKP